MSAPSLQLVTAAVIALAVALGLVRFWGRRLKAAPDVRGPGWRATLLTVLPVAAGAALYLTLFPPSVVAPGGVLVVATAGAPAMIARAPGERLVALPEAGAVIGAERAPDLATALRRRPDVRTIRVVGHGLSPRDRDVRGVAVRFEPRPAPAGIVALTAPEQVSPGARFAVAGEAGAVRGGTVELVDPEGVVAARAEVRAGARFRLTAVARAPGLALFELRLRDGGGKVVERLDVPVDAAPSRTPRVAVLAGAPSAEVKFLRRWAEDAGVALTAETEVGAGVRIGDPPPPLTAAGLAEVDLLVIDERRWASLSAGGRAALTAAVEGGMGMLLRPAAAPSTEVRRSWAALGLAIEEAGPVAPVATEEGAAGLPAPTRLTVAAGGPDAVALVRGSDGRPAAAWTARERGRIGVLTMPDSWVLQTTGRGDAHGRLWSELFSALARPEPSAAVEVRGFPRVGTRVTLCRAEGAVTVVEADGREARPIPDPAAGPEVCAGWWPVQRGWTVVRTAAGERAVYVHAADAGPSLAAAEARAATLALVSDRPTVAAGERRALGSPWPWFVFLLTLLGAAWALERLPSRASRPPEP